MECVPILANKTTISAGGDSGKETILLIPLDIIMSGWDASPAIAKLGPRESSLIMKLMVKTTGQRTGNRMSP